MRAVAARVLGLGIALPILLGAGLATPGSPVRPTCALAAGTHHVRVVVEHGNGSVLSRCVAFTADRLTGDEVMKMSAIEYSTNAYGGYGNAVCQVDGEPATYPPGCWTSTSRYWGMFVARAGGPWSVSTLGVSGQSFSDGDALGWHYIPQSGGGGGPPPSPEGVCTAVAPPPTPVVTAAPAPAATPATVPPTTPPTTSATVTSVAPPAISPSPSPHRAAPPIPPASPSAGWITTAAAAGALVGLLILQLVRPLLRR